MAVTDTKLPVEGFTDTLPNWLTIETLDLGPTSKRYSFLVSATAMVAIATMTTAPNSMRYWLRCIGPLTALPSAASVADFLLAHYGKERSKAIS